MNRICGSKKSSSDVVKDSNGALITDIDKKIERWAEHFDSLLNRPDSNMPELTNAMGQPFENVSTDPPTQEEVNLAISKLKRNKSAGCDNIQPELYKYGGAKLRTCIKNLLTDIWKENVSRKSGKPRLWYPSIRKVIRHPVQTTGEYHS